MVAVIRQYDKRAPIFSRCFFEACFHDDRPAYARSTVDSALLEILHLEVLSLQSLLEA